MEWVLRYYSGPLAAGLGVVVVLAALLAATLVLVRRSRPDATRHVVWGFATAVSVLAVLALTLVPGNPSDAGVQLVPFRTIRFNLETSGPVAALTNLAGNVALFVPLGACLGLADRLRVRGAVVLAVVLSALVEAAQYALGDRVTDVDDVILNATGALAGVAAARLAVRRLAPRLSARRAGRRRRSASRPG